MFVKACLATMLFVAAGSTAAFAAASASDRAFLTQEMQGARYELAIAKLAETKATTPAIKAYARKVTADHRQANAALLQLLKVEAVPARAGMAADDSAKLAKLKQLRGRAFDTAYIDEVTRINAEDEASFRKEASATHDARIKAYVAKFSRMDAMHKKMGDALKGS